MEFILSILFFIFEIFDIALNPSQSFAGVVASHLRRFLKNPFLFFITQFSFLYLSFCIFALGIYKIELILFWIFYLLDSGLKIIIIDKILKNRVDKELFMLLKSDIKVSINQRIFISCISVICFYACIS